MILSIVPELKTELVLSCPTNVKLLDYKSFNSLEVHPFIATHLWECVEITLSKGIRQGYIKQVLTKCNKVTARIPKDLKLDYEIISRLIEIYPHVSAELRSAFMKKKGIEDILNREGVIFER